MFLRENIGRNMSIVGKISDIMWQHMISHEPIYPEILYFDPRNGDNQIVLYAKSKIENKPNKFLKVYGIVKEIKGTSQKGQKINDGDYGGHGRSHHSVSRRW
ncbi:MAG: hypothetical protein ACTSYI_18105 [Promethearchaeota archaeon]